MFGKKGQLYAMVVAIGFTLLWSTSLEAGETIAWMSYDKAQVSRLDRKLFVYFYADWCGYCKSLEKVTFKDPAVVAYINRNYIPVRVNIDQDKKTAAYFGVGPIPDLWFLSAKGEPITHRPGFLKAPDLMPILKYIHTDSYLTQDYGQFLEKNS